MSPSKTPLLIFEKIFAVSYTALKINRAHPSIPRNMKWILQFLMMHGLFTIVFSTVVYDIYLTILAKDYSAASRDATIGVVYFVVTFQYAVLIANQKTINKIINMMKADYEKDMEQDAKDIVVMYAKNGGHVCMQWLVLGFTGASTFFLKHVFLELYTYVVDEWKLIPFYPVTLPEPLESIRNQPVPFTLIYLAMVFYLLYSGVMYVGFVPLGPTFMLHACGQLDIVKRKALSLYDDKSKSPDEVETLVKDIVKQLQYIFTFVGYINDAYRTTYEVSLMSSSAIISVTGYEVLASLKRGELSIDFLIIFFGGFAITGGPCYYSDKLMEKGEEVSLAIYSCGWETRYDPKVRKILLITLLRTAHPIAVRTHLRTVNLDAFADMLHRAYALFSLMNAAW